MQSVRDRIALGARAGLFGALLMVLAQLLARAVFGVPMLPDLVEDALLGALPPAVFARLLDALTFRAKPLAFVGILVVEVVAGALVGVVASALARDAAPAGPRAVARRGALCALALWLLESLALAPVTARGPLGARADAGSLAPSGALLATALLFGLTAAGGYQAVEARLFAGASRPVDRQRRRLLGGAAFGALAVLTAGAAFRSVTASRPALLGPAGRPAREPGWDIPTLPPEVTPVADFYVVSKNFTDPEIDPAGWSLDITGAVARPYTLTYERLLALPSHERYQTLECISNPVGGDLISTALWWGVPLRDLIAAAGPLPGTATAAFRSADGYAESLSFERAMDPENLVAYAMDGRPLEAAHGKPVRLLFPGVYGMKNVKWLTKIELLAGGFIGYWEERGWSDGTSVQTTSQIRSVTWKHPAVRAGTVVLAGFAFAADRGIGKVEVSVDAGRSWRTTTLKDPLGLYTWRFWKLDWQAAPGHYAVLVRATDRRGVVQTRDLSDPIPNGASGWDTEPAEVE